MKTRVAKTAMTPRRAKKLAGRSTDSLKAALDRDHEYRRSVRERWKRIRPQSPDEARHRLMELVDSLTRAHFSWPVAAFLAYLSDEKDTLEEAFGLTLARGARTRKSTTTRDAAALNMRLADREKWATIQAMHRISPSDGKRLLDALRSINGSKATTSKPSVRLKSKKEEDRHQDFHRRALNAAPYLSQRALRRLREEG